MLQLWAARGRRGPLVWKWAGWEERYEFRASTGTRTYSCARIVEFPNSNTRGGSLTVPGRLDWLSGLAFQLSSQQSPIASSSSLASISTPVDKDECVEIQSLYLRNGSSVGLPSLQASTQHGIISVSNFTHVGKALSSPIASFSTLDDKVKCAKIHQLYLRNWSSFGLQILQASQPGIALWVCKILPTWAKALSSPIASFSTLVAKAQCAKIRDLYLGNGFDGGLQILHGSQPNMVLWVCQILAWLPKSLLLKIVIYVLEIDCQEGFRLRLRVKWLRVKCYQARAKKII